VLILKGRRLLHKRKTRARQLTVFFLVKIPPAPDWSAPELRFVPWRTLNVATFSAAVAASSHHLVRQLGCLLDSTTAKPH